MYIDAFHNSSFVFFGVCFLSLASVDFLLLEVIMPEVHEEWILSSLCGWLHRGHSALLGTLPSPTPRWLICRQEDGLAAQVCPIYSIPTTGGSLYTCRHTFSSWRLTYYHSFSRQFRRTSVTTRINEIKKCSWFSKGLPLHSCVFSLLHNGGGVGVQMLIIKHV